MRWLLSFQCNFCFLVLFVLIISSFWKRSGLLLYPASTQMTFEIPRALHKHIKLPCIFSCNIRRKITCHRHDRHHTLNFSASFMGYATFVELDYTLLSKSLFECRMKALPARLTKWDGAVKLVLKDYNREVFVAFCRRLWNGHKIQVATNRKALYKYFSRIIRF